MGFGGGYSTPDNSAYENELAKQRQATAEAESIASQKKAQDVTTIATRIVPAELTPGEWQLRHCNETHSDGLIDVVCYQISIEVRDDCEAK